jgi:PKD repeat protein
MKKGFFAVVLGALAWSAASAPSAWVSSNPTSGTREGVARSVVVQSPAGLCSISIRGQGEFSAIAGQAIVVPITVTAVGCGGTLTYDWDFGDGTPHSRQPVPSHVWETPGTFTLQLLLGFEGGSGSASAASTVVVTEAPPPYTYLLFAAHTPGKNGTLWRTDVAALNVSGADAALDLTFNGGGQTVTSHVAVPMNGELEWQDAVASLFGITGDASGAIVAASNVPLIITARSFTPSGGGTVGQEYQAATAADTIVSGVAGVLSHLRGTADSRTNVGFLNVSDTDAIVSVRLYDGNGLQTGSELVVGVPAWQWLQITDVFTKAGAVNGRFGSHVPVGYARVLVQTVGAKVWAYASVIDNTTGDPTTITMRIP